MRSPYSSYLSSCWYICETITTVGYGDIIPTTVTGRAIGAIVAVLGIIVTSLMVGTFAVQLAPTLAEVNLLRYLETTEYRNDKSHVAAQIVTRFMQLYCGIVHQHREVHGIKTRTRAPKRSPRSTPLSIGVIDPSSESPHVNSSPDRNIRLAALLGNVDDSEPHDGEATFPVAPPKRTHFRKAFNPPLPVMQLDSRMLELIQKFILIRRSAPTSASVSEPSSRSNTLVSDVVDAVKPLFDAQQAHIERLEASVMALVANANMPMVPLTPMSSSSGSSSHPSVTATIVPFTLSPPSGAADNLQVLTAQLQQLTTRILAVAAHVNVASTPLAASGTHTRSVLPALPPVPGSVHKSPASTK